MYIPSIDKLLHFAVGVVCAWTGIAVGLTSLYFGASVNPVWTGFAASALAAVARETWNLHQGDKFDLRDIAATMLGALPVLASFWFGSTL